MNSVLASLASQLALGTLIPQLLKAGIAHGLSSLPGCYKGDENANSNPHAYSASILCTEPSPSVQLTVLKE